MALNNLFSDVLFKSLNPLPSKLAVAVSGGGDSLALLYLTNSFASKSNIEITAITVDHDLRAESAKEAEYVGQLSKNLGIKHVILKWERDNNVRVMHADSRKARYSLMTDYCINHGIGIILTAHHADDKIESFFIRLSRASGLFGLSPAESNIYKNIRILRPLSKIYKKDLVSYIDSLGIKYFDDPSNYDTKYQRSNIRKWIELMPEALSPDLFKTRILQSLDHIKESAGYMSDLFKKELEERARIYESGYASYIFKQEYNYIEFMLLSHLITIISGYDFTPRADSVKNLYNRLNSKEEVKSTLHGCVIIKKDDNVFVHRSFGKRSPVDVVLDKNIKWDNRWRSLFTNHNIKVGYLSMDDYIALKNDKQFAFIIKKCDRNILFTVPVIFENNILDTKTKKIIAIPHIGYYNDSRYGKDVLVFEPNYTSRLIQSFVRLT